MLVLECRDIPQYILVWRKEQDKKEMDWKISVKEINVCSVALPCISKMDINEHFFLNLGGLESCFLEQSNPSHCR